jgi:hypothetical protein
MFQGRFVVQAENRAGAELVGATEIHYHRAMKPTDPNDPPESELELYDVIVPGYKNTEWPVAPQTPPPERLGRIPKWLRQQRRADKKAWRHLGQVFKCTPRFDPEYFDSLPDVPPAELGTKASTPV